MVAMLSLCLLRRQIPTIGYKCVNIHCLPCLLQYLVALRRQFLRSRYEVKIVLAKPLMLHSRFLILGGWTYSVISVFMKSLNVVFKAEWSPLIILVDTDLPLRDPASLPQLIY